MKTSLLAAAVVTLTSGLALHGEVIEIAQAGFSFSPDEITAAPGDTIRFTWGGGTHTVTSGFDCTSSDIDGLSFDEPLSSSNPIVEIVVPMDFSGDIGYFCDIQVHCSSFGMAGVVHIEGGSAPGDFDGNGEINGGDLGALLAAWGTMDPKFDLNGDNAVNGGDLGIFLSLWSG